MANPVLKVSDLRKLAAYAGDALRLQVGPMALVQRPDGQEFDLHAAQETMKALMARTVEVARPKMANHALMLFGRFADMVVVPLGATQVEGTLSLGRGPDCDVLVSHPSTSTHHAQLRWDSWQRAAWLTDLGSTNGTWINGRQIGAMEVQLKEGDTLSLGDAAFLFLSVETLQAIVRGPAQSGAL